MMRALLTGAITAVALLAPPTLHAHALSVAHVDIEVSDGAPVRMELDLSLRDLALTVPLDANRDEQVTWGELEDAREPIEALVTESVQLSTAVGPCRLVPEGLATRRYDDGGYATLRLLAHCPASTGLSLDYRLFRDRDPDHRAHVTLRRDGQASAAIARGAPVRFDVAIAGSSAGFVDYLREGVHHILIGYDHLAFLLTLLLTASLVRAGGAWQAASGWRPALMQALGIITAFTVAHSITLSLAALGWVTPASRAVEAAIAASVLVAALNNIRVFVARRLWLLAFGFGLIHGFGFAGALGELGLPTGARVSALLGFNAGVELGQVAAAAVALPVLFVMRGSRTYVRGVLPVVSLLIAALACYWLWERLAG